MDNICSYLQSQNPENKFTKKELRHPSLMSFNEILFFLVTKIDPSIKEISSSEDVIIEQVQNLGYHIPIHPSTFKSVGLPNNWH